MNFVSVCQFTKSFYSLLKKSFVESYPGFQVFKQ